MLLEATTVTDYFDVRHFTRGSQTLYKGHQYRSYSLWMCLVSCSHLGVSWQTVRHGLLLERHLKSPVVHIVWLTASQFLARGKIREDVWLLAFFHYGKANANVECFVASTDLMY